MNSASRWETVHTTGAQDAIALRKVVAANEEIKGIITLSSTVNLAALDAMLVARRSGARSRGFAVVSSELGTFSRALEGAMSGLGGVIFRLVSSSAAMQNQDRQRRVLMTTLGMGRHVSRRVEAVLDGQAEAILATRQQMDGDIHLLRAHLARALQLCTAGAAISRSAKIEAVYGGAMSSALGHAAAQFEQTVDRIVASVEGLISCLGE